ncbi:hypothetical protein ACA910_001331 [Epithemia clementina (nom. ined.)]
MKEARGLGTKDRERFVVYREHVSKGMQKSIVDEALQAHRRYSDKQIHRDQWNLGNESKTSIKLEMGIGCGCDLTSVLPEAASVARSAFRRAAASDFASIKPLVTMSDVHTPLTGLALMYGLAASMPPHYDSPTQPGKREEWLCMITIGQSVLFRCNDETLKLESGDVLVMDSMSVLHGVNQICNDAKHHHSLLGLPVQARLGVLFWQGRTTLMTTSDLSPNQNLLDDLCAEELASLFSTDD